MAQTEFLQSIEQFLEQSGISASTFGREAVGDPTFVSRARKGARCWPETQEKCLKYIEENKEAIQ